MEIQSELACNDSFLRARNRQSSLNGNLHAKATITLFGKAHPKLKTIDECNAKIMMKIQIYSQLVSLACCLLWKSIFRLLAMENNFRFGAEQQRESFR